MRDMTRTSRINLAALAICLCGLLSQSAQAARVNVDFDGDSFDTTGENFALADSHFGTGSGAVPFNLNFGSGSNSYDFCFNPNGFVSFVASGNPCSASSTPTGNYIAPFAAALTTGGNTLWSTGVVDSTAPYVLADAVDAMRFVWQATDSANNDILVELVLLNRDAGNFDFEFRYGSPAFGVDGAPATGQQGFSLGSNILALTSGPFSTTTNYNYSFVGGVCTTCGTTNPPTVFEPSSLVLMAGALLMLPLFGRRRSFRSAC